MKRQAGPVKKRKLSPRPRPQNSLKLKVKPQIINFAVIGDSHVGYGNSSAIFRKLLPKAVGSGNKKFVIFGGDNAGPEPIMEIMPMPSTRTSRMRLPARSGAFLIKHQ